MISDILLAGVCSSQHSSCVLLIPEQLVFYEEREVKKNIRFTHAVHFPVAISCLCVREYRPYRRRSKFASSNNSQGDAQLENTSPRFYLTALEKNR